jgi:predicted O-linked N-acetylglucosamine transferase (SPINDLY family)
LHPDQDERVIAAVQREWNRHILDPVRPSIRPHTNDRNRERRLRIGYVSPDFRRHVVGINILPLFKHHDSENFEIVCYSGVLKPDSLTDEFRQRTALWRETYGVPDEALAETIRRDGVDILVDLSQHAAGNRLSVFAHQPAPVQVSFAGYPESTGLETIEYRISDRWLEAGGSAFRRTERVHLIESFWCYEPHAGALQVNALPAKESGYVTFGSLNSFCKINEPLLELWAQVLGSVEGSRLVLLAGAGAHRQWLTDFLESKGVAAQRVEFVERRPRHEYLELYHRLDAVLDPFPYNGHSTSLDALWMGVPVVTQAGRTCVSRGGLSILSNLGLSELVGHSGEEYVRIAVELARDLPRLAGWRAALRARMQASVLMDAPRFARNIETAYRAMWRDWCARQAR